MMMKSIQLNEIEYMYMPTAYPNIFEEIDRNLVLENANSKLKMNEKKCGGLHTISGKCRDLRWIARITL